MAWYEDLAPCDYFSEDSSHIRAVGWLSRAKRFRQGEVPEPLFEKLCQLLIAPWNPAYSAGFHECELCHFSGGNGMTRYRDFQFSGTSSASLFIPGDGIIYVAPSSIAHYIDAHGYLPPEEFCQAVLDCPPMRSVPYLKALLANGGRALIQSE